MRCLGCGGSHFDNERICPRTKRPIEDGPFGSLVGPYRVGKLLGAGGFGAVHVADDTRTGASVALKLLHPELVADQSMLDRFIREAEVTVRAGNPHIVRVLEASFTGRSVYVALELLAGDTLANTMRSGPIEPERAVDITIQMLDGLAVAHAAGVIHRDIKPANVFLADEPAAPRSLVKLLDFGIGRMLTADLDQRLTRTGAQLGTPHFMAPEQVADSKRADARADLYAVAVTLFAMLSGTRPYGAVSIGEWITLVTRRAEPPRVTSPLGPLPPLLVEVIAIGLSVDPARRFQDAGALARGLLDSMPNSPAVTRALPALQATTTFAAPDVQVEPSMYGSAQPARQVAADALGGRRSDAGIANENRGALTHAAMIVGGVLVAMLIAGAVGVVVVALVTVARPAASPAIAQVAATPVVTLTPATPSPAAAPPPVEDAGVHFAPATLDPDSEVDLRLVEVILHSDLQRFERCRVPGRATHAAVAVAVKDGTGELLSLWPTTTPHGTTTNDDAVSRCVATRFSEAAVGMRFGHGHGGFVLTADLDAR